MRAKIHDQFLYAFTKTVFYKTGEVLQSMSLNDKGTTVFFGEGTHFPEIFIRCCVNQGLITADLNKCRIKRFDVLSDQDERENFC